MPLLDVIARYFNEILRQSGDCCEKQTAPQRYRLKQLYVYKKPNNIMGAHIRMLAHEIIDCDA